MLNIAGILLLTWSLALLFSRGYGGAVHILPVVAAGLIVYSWIRHRRNSRPATHGAEPRDGLK